MTKNVFSYFHIEDFRPFEKALNRINDALEIESLDVEGSATMRINGDKLIVYATKFKADEKEEKPAVQFTMEFDVDFFSMDDITWYLNKILGIE